MDMSATEFKNIVDSLEKDIGQLSDSLAEIKMDIFSKDTKIHFDPTGENAKRKNNKFRPHHALKGKTPMEYLRINQADAA
jgi:hypothetical protein